MGGVRSEPRLISFSEEAPITVTTLRGAGRSRWQVTTTSSTELEARTSMMPKLGLTASTGGLSVCASAAQRTGHCVYFLLSDSLGGTWAGDQRVSRVSDCSRAECDLRQTRERISSSTNIWSPTRLWKKGPPASAGSCLEEFVPGYSQPTVGA